MDEEFKKRIAQAKAAGYTDEQINAVIQAKQQQDAARQQPQPQQQTQGMPVNSATQQPQDKGFIRNMAEAIVKPGVDAAKLVAGTGFEIARAGSYALGDKDAYDIHKGKQNPFLTRQEIMEKYNTPGNIVKNVGKTAAGAASYFVPGGKAVSVGGKILQGVRTGATVGGLYGASQGKGETVDQIAADAIEGGISGGVTGGLFGAASGVVSKLRGGGDALRRGVVKPKVQPDPFMAEDEKAIASTLQKFGLKGSAEAQKQQVPNVFRSISEKIQQQLSSSKGRIKTADATQMIDDALDNNINFDADNPVMLKTKDKFLNQLVKKANQGEKTALELNPKQLFEFKQNLGKQLSNTFKKVEKGTPLTEKEEVALTIWGTIDDMLTKAEPGVKEMTKAQSYLYKAMPGLAKEADKGLSIPVIGNIGTGANRMAQATQDATGRVMQTVGSAVDKIPGGVNDLVTKGAILSQDAGQQGAADMLNTQEPPTQDVMGAEDSQAEQIAFVSPDNQWKVLADGRTLSMDNQWKWDEASSDWIPNEEYLATQQTGGVDFSDEDVVVQLMQEDLATTGGKNIPEIKSMYEIATKGKGGSLTATQQKRMAELDRAEGIYNMVEQLALDAGTGVGAFAKANIGKLPGVEGGSEEDLGRVTEALAKGLAGALASEVGVATDRDIQRWMGLMPKVTDTMAERQRVLERLKTEIQRSREAVGNYSEEDQTETQTPYSYTQ